MEGGADAPEPMNAIDATVRPLSLCFVGWADHIHLERWAGHFATAGHDVSILSLSGKGRYPPGVRQYVLRFAAKRPGLLELEMRLRLMQLRPRLVHVHWSHFAVPVASAWSGPLAITAWGSDIYRDDQFTRDQWLAMSRAMSRADLLTCDSEDLARAMSKKCHVPKESVHVVQWGVDVDRFAAGRSELAHELGIADRPVVFSARNFTPIYNQETVVEAFALARESVPSAFLLMKNFGGDAAYLDAIRERIRALGLEHHCRIVDSLPYAMMPDLYRAARVMVSIPLSDATSMSLLEAMSCGSLPLLSDLPSQREWVLDGKNGLLVPPTDAEAVARGMIRGLTDERLQIEAAESNRKLVLAKANQAVHMAQCEQLYRDALGSARGGSFSAAQ